MWIYSDRVTGTLTAVSPGTTAPTSVTVAGGTYELGTSTAVYQFSSQGDFSAGDTVTLSIYRNGETTTVDVTLDEENTDRNAAMDELQQEYSASQQQQSQQQQQQGGYFQWPFGW